MTSIANVLTNQRFSTRLIHGGNSCVQTFDASQFLFKSVFILDNLSQVALCIEVPLLNGCQLSMRRKQGQRDGEEMREIYPNQAESRDLGDAKNVMVIDPDDCDKE